MNLEKKKKLAQRTFEGGRKRIIFVQSRLNEIKEAITKQDIRDLHRDGAIIIKEIKGRKTKKLKKVKKRFQKRRKNINKRKQKYVKLTRKLREYITQLRNQGRLTKEEVLDIRKKIKDSKFKNKIGLREYIEAIKK